ncbi:hypothetical protein [Aliikangiella maris]|uniref:Uncharacterized protein n=2 Tax=Aliikangiella maris TaxID=3162458 RepID=A0ABV3MIY0_9GAMM
MGKSAKSLFVFSVYLLLLGIALTILPNPIIQLFNFPATSEPWIRTTGMLLIIITPYYFYAIKHNWLGFFQVTVYTRASVICFFIVFVSLGWARPELILFSIIDLAGATWTQLCLNAERKKVFA